MIIDKIGTGDIKIDELHDIDLSQFSLEELQVIVDQCEDRTAYWNTNQMALKISMNSLYGALSNQYFVLFNRDIAASITGNGRIYIRGLSHYINNKLNTMFGNEKDYIIYNDTDSLTSDALIETNNFGEISIGDYYELTKGNIEVRGANNLIKHLDNIDKTYSVGKDGEININKIKYVMKHKVKKRMYKITIESKMV